MKHISLLKTAALFLILLLGAYSCKKNDKNNPSNSTSAITADKASYFQYEIATFTAENVQFSQQTYDGTLNGQVVKMSVVENKLGFLVPKITAGSYSLNLTIDGNMYTTLFNVSEAPAIADPATYLNTRLDPVINNNDTYWDAMLTATQGIPGAEHNAENIQIIKDLTNDFVAKLNVATNEEKEVLAYFIQANPELVEPLNSNFVKDSLSVFKTTEIQDEQLRMAFQELDRRCNKLILSTAVLVTASIATFSIPGVNILVGTLSAVAVTNQLMDIHGLVQNRILGRALYLAELTDVEVHKGTATEFTNGQQHALRSKSVFRNLNAEDMNSTMPVIVGLIKSLNKFENVWNKVKSLASKKLTGEPAHIKNVTEVHTKEFDTDPKYLSIENISNPNVTASVDNSGGEFKVTFSTSETTSQSFTYDMVYNNPDVVRNETSFSGIIKGTDDTTTNPQTPNQIIDSLKNILTDGLTKNWRVTYFYNSYYACPDSNANCKLDDIWTFNSDGTCALFTNNTDLIDYTICNGWQGSHGAYACSYVPTANYNDNFEFIKNIYTGEYSGSIKVFGFTFELEVVSPKKIKLKYYSTNANHHLIGLFSGNYILEP